jgi:hypothetical protein
MTMDRGLDSETEDDNDLAETPRIESTLHSHAADDDSLTILKFGPCQIMQIS